LTRVDFYLLADVDPTARLRFACRLAARALATRAASTPGSSGHVYLHAENPATVRELDDLLWSYPPRRFLPHAIVENEAASAAPILIGCGQPVDADGVLINVSDGVPGFFGRFERVAEIVLGNARAAGRDRYRHYRDRGYPLQHHELEDWEA
jgi:DNA polymerase-3 subunit chi